MSNTIEVDFWRSLGNFKEEAKKELSRHFGTGTSFEIKVYMWQQAFNSTTGPRPGIGGQRLTEFPILAFVDDFGNAWVHCVGIKKFIPAEEFRPFTYINFKTR